MSRGEILQEPLCYGKHTRRMGATDFYAAVREPKPDHVAQHRLTHNWTWRGPQTHPFRVNLKGGAYG